MLPHTWLSLYKTQCKGNYESFHDVRLLHTNVFILKLSLVIVLTRWDIVNTDRLAHVILLDWIK